MGTVPRTSGKRPRRGAVQRLGAVLAPLALAALLAGCVHPSDSGGGSGSGGSASTASPSAEDTNPDSSAGQDGHRGSGVSLSLAGLPAGSGGALKDTCFNINWTGDQVEIPAGDSISIGVAPDGNFSLTDAVGAGCGSPDCHQVTWTSNSHETCAVAITAPGDDPASAAGQLQVSGTLTCTGAGVSACHQFRDSLDLILTSIPVGPAGPDGSESPPDTSPSVPDDGSSMVTPSAASAAP